MMSHKSTPPLLLLLLFMVSGVVSQYGWGVYYTSNSICAVKGSTVIMGCRYSYPSIYTFQKAFWTKEWPSNRLEPPDLSTDTNYINRVKYLGNQLNICSLSLEDVTEQDRGPYYFRFLTTTPEGKYQGQDGVELTVTELRVMIPDSVVEGRDVTLTCTTSCSLTEIPTFIWNKPGTQSSITSDSNSLHLRSVSKTDAGMYRCSVERQKYWSPAVTLDVQYPPKSVSVSISTDGEIVEGSSVTLTCSSDANPPVERYTWYKGGVNVKTGNTLTMDSIRSEDSGVYTCRTGNKHGYQSSTAVTLNVMYPPKSVSVSISPDGEIVEGSLVTLTCSSDANPPVQRYTWYKGGAYERTGNTITMDSIRSEDSGVYTCRAGNKHGYQSSTAVTLNVMYPPKSVSVSISTDGEIVEGSLVTLTCSSDANPPVQRYTWYKMNESSPVGSGPSYRFSLSSSSSGWFYCEVQNKHGSQRSAAVPLTLNGDRSFLLYIILGVTAGCGCLIAIFVVAFIKRRRRGGLADDVMPSQENTYNTVNLSAVTNNAEPAPAPENQDEVQYASIQHRTATRSPYFGSKAADEVQYATVQRSGAAEQIQDDPSDLYATVGVNHNAAAHRSAAPDESVIYSSCRN